MRRAFRALVALAAASAWMSPAAHGADQLYWGNAAPNTVSFANLDGSGGGAQLNIAGTTADTPEGTAIDPATNRIYWANFANHSISYASLDGTGGGQLNVAGAPIYNPEGIAIDPALNKIYWANYTGTIGFANLDGSGHGGQLDTTGVTTNAPQGIAIDPSANRLYWTNSNGTTISYTNLDGTGHAGNLNTGTATVNGPRGLAIDPLQGRIYWPNFNANKISYANLNGSGGGDLNTGTATVNSVEGIAIDPVAGKVYWGNENANTIYWAKLDGSGTSGQLVTPGATPDGPDFPALLEAPGAIGPPVVTTTANVLGCTQGQWAPDLLGSFLFRTPRTYTYQWSLNGAVIAGATASAYLPTRPGTYTCRVTATNHAGSASQVSQGHVVSQVPPPRLTSLAETNRVFAVGRAITRITGLTAATRKRGTVFSFVLDQPAIVKIVIRKRVKRRMIKILTLTRTAHAGRNSVRFSGRMRRSILLPGGYQAAFTAANDSAASAPKTLGFRIVKAKRSRR